MKLIDERERERLEHTREHMKRVERLIGAVKPEETSLYKESCQRSTVEI